MNCTKLTNFSLCLTMTLTALTSACDDNVQFPYCEETVTVLGSLDDETPAGVTPAQVLELIEGERVVELQYVEDSDNAVHVEIEPGGSGSTELSLALTHDGGEVRWIDAEEAPLTGSGPVAAIAIECPDRLEIDARLGFATADGAFTELFDVVIRAEVDYEGVLGLARITQRFDPEALVGALEILSISPADPVRVDHEIEVHYPLIGDADEIGEPLGWVGGGAEYRDGKGDDGVAGYGMFELGRFGGWALGD